MIGHQWPLLTDLGHPAGRGECPQFLESGHWDAIALAAPRSYRLHQPGGREIELPLWSHSDTCARWQGLKEPSSAYPCANASAPRGRASCGYEHDNTSAPVPPGHALAMRWLLGLVFPAAARLARIHLVRELGTRPPVRTPRTLRRASVPRACILEFRIIIVVLARAAPERVHVATWRVPRAPRRAHHP
jgi:hypothetical protein